MKAASKWMIVRCLAVLVTAMWMGHSSIGAQVRIRDVSALPFTSTETGWCIMKPEKRAYYWYEGAWHEAAGKGYDSGEIINRYALLYGSLIDVYDPAGKLVASRAVRAVGDDSVLVVQLTGNQLLLNTLGDTISYLLAGSCNRFGMADTIQSRRVYCAASPMRLLAGYACEEIHSWGIIGADGRWLIPPIYDHPFAFRDGLATVKHYGRERTINERGEFVD